MAPIFFSIQLFASNFIRNEYIIKLQPVNTCIRHVYASREDNEHVRITVIPTAPDDIWKTILSVFKVK